jgi:hypothetical protein
MALSQIQSDLHVGGTLTVKKIILPSESVGDAQIATTALISAEKLTHQVVLTHYCEEAVASPPWSTSAPYIAPNDGQLVSVQAMVAKELITGGYVVNVDVQRVTDANSGSVTWTSMLTAPIEITSSTAMCAVQTAAIATETYDAGSIIRIKVWLSGSGTSTGNGFVCTVVLQEVGVAV